ncbi:MAG: TonB-dependent receptor, partial [Steroidobacteraceae bacterium]
MKGTARKSVGWYVALAISSLATAAPATAQESSSTQTDREGPGEIGEIIVTAQRRQETIQDVPLSVSAVTADMLSEAKVEGVRDLRTMAAGLSVNQKSYAYTPTIRGVGSLDVTAGQEPGVATYVDGVYLSSAYGANFTFNNVERIEVLKGPQGTLFGRNATGGAIQIITKDPSDSLEIETKAGLGNLDTQYAQAYIGGGVTEALAGDIALNYRRQGEGAGRNVFLDERIPGNEDFGVRSKWIYKFDDGGDFTFAADYSEQTGFLGNNKTIVPGTVFNAGTTQFAALPDFQDIQQSLTPDATVEFGGVSARYRDTFGNVDLQSITAYRFVDTKSIFDNDALPISIIDVFERFRVRTLTQEFQLTATPADSLQMVAGAFFMKDENGYDAPGGISLIGAAFPDPVTGDPASVSLIHNIKTTSLSAFAEATLEVRPTTKITAGARITSDRKSFDGRTEVNAADGSLLVTVPTPSDKKRWTEPTWRLVVQQEIGSDAMLYASYNRGFRSGTYNTVSVTSVPIDPEYVNAFEIGVKSELFDRRLRLNGAVFHNKFKDLQVVLARGTNLLTLNAGNATIKGAEIELEAVLTNDLSLRASASYLDSEYDKFGDTTCTRVESTGEVTGFTCDPAGNPIIQTPKPTFSLGANYEHDIGTGSIGANATLFRSSKFNWEPYGRLVEPSYTLLNGEIFWRSTDKRYRVAVWAKNLTDEEYSLYSVA